MDEYSVQRLLATRRLVASPWRTGRHNDRTLYAVVGNEPTREDVTIGFMDPGLGQHIVDVHNASLDKSSEGHRGPIG